MAEFKRKKWILQYREGDSQTDEQIHRLAESAGLSPIMAKLLWARGYRTAEQVFAFLRQDDSCLHDPYLMQDMDRAVARIEQALSNHERIAIYGDYDVDGVTAVSLLYLYLKEQGADVGYYIPSRTQEGYGLSAPAIDRLREKGVSLMITVDTGITATEETAYAKSIGIDTVVTDHHECRDCLPEVSAVVNPHRPDNQYPFVELAGVGVVFKLICAYEMMLCKKSGTPVIDGIRRVCHEYTDLVAIGTIADVMPIVNENRLIVSMGLRSLASTKRLGIRALIDASLGGKNGKKRKINSSFIGFTIAPRMNAAGRVSNASIAVELLLAERESDAVRLAEKLCELNSQRQIEENRIAEQAYQKIEQLSPEDRARVIVIDDDTWKQGIIGIVSSRITEKYGLPSILISFDGAIDEGPQPTDVGKGSGRSVKGMNLVDALNDSADLLTRYGGHELAAGLSISRANISAFRKRINAYAANHLEDDALCVSMEATCEVQAGELTMALAEEIPALEPFGVSNPIPSFVLRDAQICRILPMAGGKHTKFLLRKDGVELQAVWFGANATQLHLEMWDRVDVLFQLSVNEFQNSVSLQLILSDMRLSETFESEMAYMKSRYASLCNGETHDEEECFLPTRDDMAAVYRYLRHAGNAGYTFFPIRRILTALHQSGNDINYVKLRFILCIMQELHLCGVTEPVEDSFIFEFYNFQSKTSIEKSSVLHRLKSQLNKKRNLSENA